MEPPQLFFPEKVTRLVARDTSLQAGKLVCKDTMWWDGIEFAQQSPKLGLLGKRMLLNFNINCNRLHDFLFILLNSLGKIWSGSGFRRLSQIQDMRKSLHKIHQQVSLATDTSSAISSITDSDDDGSVTVYEDSSVEEDSYFSEESNAQIMLRTKSKIQKKLKNQVVWR